MSALRNRAAPGRLVIVALLAGLLAACSSTDRPKALPLEPITAKIAGRQVWTQRVGKVDFPLVVASRNDLIVSASGDGTVAAFAAADGAERWRTSIGARIAAGVGSDGRFASVVTRDNELVALDNGVVIWRKRLSAPVATPPLVAGERIFVLAVDRSVHAFDALDGRKLWSLQRPGEALTLAQAGVLSAYRDTLLVGSGPRLLSVDPLRGVVRWEVAVASPRGTNEVERLADLVGPAQRQGDVFCMRAFQAAVGCVDAGRGQALWSHAIGGIDAVGGDADFVVAADASSRLTARKRAGGELAWTNERLLNRGLSGPAMVGTAVVMGDFEGQVHFLDRSTGEPVLRLGTDGSPVIAQPAVAGTTLVIATRDGGLFAFRPE